MSGDATRAPNRPGSMLERVTAFDWAATPLGAPGSWPEGLAAAARTLLDRPFPEALLWGPDAVCCAYNDACRPLLDGGPEALGRRFLDVWPEAREVLAPLLERALRGEGVGREEVPVPCGGAVGERRLDLAFSPVRAPDGSVVAALVHARDRTERVRERAGLHEGLERLRLAAEATGFASYDFDVETRTSDWSNPIHSLVQGEPAGPVPQERIFERVHPDDRESFERFVREALGATGPRRQAAEFRIVRGDGGVRWVRDSNQVLFEERDGAPRAVRVVGTLQDVTERRAAEEALRESNAAKDEFLAILGHELRNPLAPIRTALDVLQEPSTAPGTSGQLIAMMDRQLSHLTRLVDDLLNLSRINRGDIEVERAPLRLDEVVATAVEQVRDLAAARGHGLTATSAAALRVTGDFERLTQVVANLVSNAVKYTEPGGRIDVSAVAEGGAAAVRVRDTGHGIPPEHLEDVFSMFHQVPEHRRLGAGGLGIGLALARRVAALHGGSVEAASEGLGRGSEFTLRLPLNAGPTPPPERRAGASQDATGSPDAPRRRVLVVDDNVDAAAGLARLLEFRGHDVAIAHAGASALEALERHDPELVLLDLGMPGMDGFEVARRMRALPGGDGRRIVALTGRGRARDREATRDAGFDDHLVKPVRAAAVLSLLAGIDARRERVGPDGSPRA